MKDATSSKGMRDLTILITALLLCGASLADSFSWADFRDRVAAAVEGGERAELIALRETRQQNPADPPEWNAYWQSYLAYRAAYLGGDDEPDKEQLEACAESARQAIDGGEESGESHALLGLCYGQLAGTGMMAGMRYGSKAQAALDEALLIAPDNPRVLLAAGVNDLYTPVRYGGDVERAERRLSRAIEQLAASSSSPAWQPAWGAVDAHGHLATALLKLERPEAAMGVLQRAGDAGLESPWLEALRAGIDE